MYELDVRGYKPQEIYSLGEHFSAESKSGRKLEFTNFYMMLDGKPFFGISGEFHFSRMHEDLWEDEIIKMKMAGINTISTYVFWNHHEEIEGEFDFTGQRNLRRFVEICQKYGLFVIVRIGPFDHGEVRNGGLPDWLYGKPFEVRKVNDGFLSLTKRLYSQIGEQLKGLYFQDDGPIIAAQIDNEYMHSSAPWEMTTGISNEWVFGGDDRELYMESLRQIAMECGITPPFYTCTGWGGAITPENMMPLWGGYAYRPWLFYDGRGEHPATEEYVYQDFHHDNAHVTSDFDPAYTPSTRPYACCEMGGGMMNTYYYRFELPYKSVDAMSNIKIASGCNFVGYYVFQGGTNPVGKKGVYLNEGQVPKMSYDYQAAIGEFGQLRESYHRLKNLHYFCQSVGEKLCTYETILPEGASEIASKDLDTLRFALRTDGTSGFLFLNNFQDHVENQWKRNESICLHMKNEDITFENITLAPEENCILPINLDMSGILLKKATAQLVTRIDGDVPTYVFLRPEGMETEFYFEKEVRTCDVTLPEQSFEVEQHGRKIRLLVLSRERANQFYLLSDGSYCFSDGAVMEDGSGVRIENDKNAKIPLEIKQTAASRYTIQLEKSDLLRVKNKEIKDIRLQILYQGDIAGAYIDGDMITDNFCNGVVWEIGLKTYVDRLLDNPLTIVITPLKAESKVNVESAMAARMENVSGAVAELISVKTIEVYETRQS